nr:MAG: hypothetical protein [Betatorquevirus sp.]
MQPMGTTLPRNTDTGHIGHGRRGNTTRGNQATQKRAAPPPTPNQQAPQPTSSIKIHKCTFNVKLFDDDPPKNRRMTAWEFKEELEDAAFWHRAPRMFIKDRPTYPWVPQDTPFTVNFDLNAPK